MTRIPRSNSGHAIVEALLMIPLLSLMLVGIHAASNQLSMLSVSESASHSEALRAARRQGSVSSRWNDSFPDEKPMSFQYSSGSGARILPSPFPSLAGRARVSVSIDRKWDSWVRNDLQLDTQRLERADEVSGDCWENDSASGRKLQDAVNILVWTGVF